MTYEKPHADRAYREARRAAARAHHPDAGGDAESLIAALREIDNRYARIRPSAPIVGMARRNPVARGLTTVRKLLPSRRRYVDLPRRNNPHS